ncbi:hypothetical protein Unana1_07952 [Umbelopsis nana]
MSTFHPPPHLMPLHSHRLQPQSSATRDVELQYDKVDAEASSILIALANHNRKEQHASEMVAAAAMKSLAAATGQDLSCASFLAATKRSIPVLDTKIASISYGSSIRRASNARKSISPSQDTSASQTRQAKRPAPPTSEDQPRQKLIAVEQSSPAKDPILLLAAAAAAVDSKHQEEVHERHRASSAVTDFETSHSLAAESNPDDKTPFTSDTSHQASVPPTTSSSYNHHHHHHHQQQQQQQQPYEDHNRSYYKSEKHPHPSPPSHHDSHGHHIVSREVPSRNLLLSQPPPSQAPMRSSDRSNIFSHQYLSMKQNPKIKRNAMHAYITYMIYADLSHKSHQPSPPAMKDIKTSNGNTRMKSGPAGTSSSIGSRSYSSTPSQPSSAFYSGSTDKDMRYDYRRDEKPYSSSSSSRGYQSYSQQPTEPRQPHSYASDSYSHRSQPDSERSNGSMSRMSTPSLPPLPATSRDNNRSPYGGGGSDYYSPTQQRSSPSWSRSSVPPPSLPPLHGYGSSRPPISPSLRPSILPPPPPSSSNEGRSSIPPPLPLPTSSRDKTSASSSPIPNNNIFNRPLTAFLWSDGAAPARPPLNDRILPPVSKTGNDHGRPDTYYDRT